MPDLYPLLFKPILKNYIWGGRNLEKIGRELPENEKVAESWEIAAHPDGMTSVKNGPYAGKSLEELLLLLGEELVGHNNLWALERLKFPLLVKLIDANRRLSVQVHPGDAYAIKHEGNELGKTEMWVILNADPDAAIIYGLEDHIDAETLHNSINSGELAYHLHQVPIKAGDHICVSSGTLHAIMEGALLVEIQQNSNTTYRVFDWNRVDDHGAQRELHVKKALDVIDFDKVRPSLENPRPLQKGKGWSAEELCSNHYFTTERYSIEKNHAFSGLCDGATLEIWGLLSGEITINNCQLEAVEFVLLPAAMGAYQISAKKEAVLLRTYVKPNGKNLEP